MGKRTGAATTEATDQAMSIPSLDSDPRYAAAAHTYHDLVQELQRGQERAREIRVELGQMRSGRSGIQAQAEALLAGKDPLRDGASSGLDSETRRLEAREPVLRKAISIQEAVLRRVRGEVSGEICAKLRSRFVALIRRRAHILLELGANIEEELRIHGELSSKDISFGPVAPGIPLWAGSPLDINSPIAGWLREAALQAEIIGADEIPSTWWESWRRG